ncbi:UDP-glucose 4-epimerase GalE [Marivirga lumbricoides]
MKNGIKNILVTGGAGYIGSHTVEALSEKGYKSIIVDDFRNSDKSVMEGLNILCKIKPLYFEIDCTDEKLMRFIFKYYKIDGVIHFAAYKAVGESIDKPDLYFHNNIQSLTVVTKLMNEFGISNLVFSSSCTVYGQPDSVEVSEDQEHKPASSPYGYTKQVGEQYLDFLSKSSQNIVKSTLLRYFNPIGAHPSGLIGELPNGVPNNLVPYICQSAIGLIGPLTVFGNDYDTPDGTCVRDFIHVVDLANAHIAALEKQFSSEASISIYNVGTGKGTSVLELINTFEMVTGETLLYNVGPRREGDIVKIYANTQKVNKELAWKSEYTVADALLHAWKWQKQLVYKRSIQYKIDSL